MSCWASGRRVPAPAPRSRTAASDAPCSDEGLAARIQAVVALARELADQLGPEFNPRPEGNVSRFSRLFEKLIVQAVSPRGEHWEAQLAKARAKVEAAWDMFYELVRQVGLADGFMEDLRTMSKPPLLAMQRERAGLDFARTCRRVVAAVAPGAGAEDPAFRPSQVEPPRLFDVWNPAQHLGDHDVAVDLMMLVQVVESVVRTPPFDVHLKRKSQGITRLLKAAHRAFPDRPVVLGVVGSPATVRCANAYLELEPPAASLSEVYRRDAGETPVRYQAPSRRSGHHHQKMNNNNESRVATTLTGLASFWFCAFHHR